MPGINENGAPDTRDLIVGRGRLMAAKLTAAGLPDANGFRHLGNAPEFNLTVNVEDLRHVSSLDALGFTDKRVVISREVEMSLVLEEVNYENYALFFAGTAETYDNPHDTTFDHADAVITSAVKLGRWYPLYDDQAVPQRVYDLGAAGVVYSFEEDPTGTPQALTEGVDYELDHEMGHVRFLPTAVNVAEGDEVGWAITTGASTPQDIDTVQGLTVADESYALLFVEIDPANGGQKAEWLFHKVSLSADGEMGLISNEWRQIPLTGLAESNSAITVGSKVLQVRTFDQAA
jgi:hypothetical protein